MICAMCLQNETSFEHDQLCEVCMHSLKYAEELIKKEGVGLKVVYNRGDLAPIHKKPHWIVEMTQRPDQDGTLDQTVFTGTADILKDACDMAFANLKGA